MGEIKVLPSLPSIYQDLMQEMQAPQGIAEKAFASSPKISRMMTKILQLVNSAFSDSHHVSDPEQAVASSVSIRSSRSCFPARCLLQFEQGRLPSSFPLEALWRHAPCSLVPAHGGSPRTPVEVSRRLMRRLLRRCFRNDGGVLVLAANVG